MKKGVKKDNSYTVQHRMVLDMIDAGFSLAEKLGGHPLTKGCNCIACVNKRKRILQTPKKNWKIKL